MENILCEIQKNTRETIRVAVSDFNGYQLLAVRVFTENKDGVLVPTKKGITLQLATWKELLPDLQKAVKKETAANGTRKDTFDSVVKMLNEGFKRSEIAEELGVDRSTVSRHIKKALAEGLVEENDVA